MFLAYWNRPEATPDKFVGDWLLTGDRGHVDEDGYIWFQARNDDVITSGRLPHRPRRDRGLPAPPSRRRDGRRGRGARSAPQAKW